MQVCWYPWMLVNRGAPVQYLFLAWLLKNRKNIIRKRETMDIAYINRQTRGFSFIKEAFSSEEKKVKAKNLSKCLHSECSVSKLSITKRKQLLHLHILLLMYVCIFSTKAWCATDCYCMWSGVYHLTIQFSCSMPQHIYCLVRNVITVVKIKRLHVWRDIARLAVASNWMRRGFVHPVFIMQYICCKLAVVINISTEIIRRISCIRNHFAIKFNFTFTLFFPLCVVPIMARILSLAQLFYLLTRLRKLRVSAKM